MYEVSSPRSLIAEASEINLSSPLLQFAQISQHHFPLILHFKFFFVIDIL